MRHFFNQHINVATPDCVDGTQTGLYWNQGKRCVENDAGEAHAPDRRPKQSWV